MDLYGRLGNVCFKVVWFEFWFQVIAAWNGIAEVLRKDFVHISRD